MQISRRNALTGATAVVAVAAVPVTVQANDDHIAALYAEWREAEATWGKANEIADNTHMDALRACGEYPMEGGYTSKAQFDAARDAGGAAYWAAYVQPDIVELKRKADVTAAAESAALHRFIEAPAEGPRGVLIKITAFIEEIEVVGMDDRMLVTIRNDPRKTGETQTPPHRNKSQCLLTLAHPARRSDFKQ